jgi:hypothetical protein
MPGFVLICHTSGNQTAPALLLHQQRASNYKDTIDNSTSTYQGGCVGERCIVVRARIPPLHRFGRRYLPYACTALPHSSHRLIVVEDTEPYDLPARG